MKLKEGLEEMSKLIANPIVRLAAFIVFVAGVFIFCSFTFQKSASDQLADYAHYQFKQSIREVLAEEVTPALKQNGEAIARLEVKTDALVQGTYDEIIRQVEKTYEKYKKGDYGDFTKTNFDALSKNWKMLPDEKKTDALKMKYDALMKYYPNLN